MLVSSCIGIVRCGHLQANCHCFARLGVPTVKISHLMTSKLQVSHSHNEQVDMHTICLVRSPKTHTHWMTARKVTHLGQQGEQVVATKEAQKICYVTHGVFYP